MTDTLKSLRRRAGLSQADLARRCGVRQATLSAIEGGRARPQRATVAALAAALRVEMDDLARVLRQRDAAGAALPIAGRKAGTAADALGLGDWPFLAGLDTDLRAGLGTALVAQWSHSSTAIEGNTISAGDTVFVLSQGLTVSGKTLREHQELHGHAQAIRLMAAWTRRGHPIGIAQLHDLHRAVQTGAEVDALAPLGKWKVEPNGTNAITSKGTSKWHDYASPAEVPALVAAWLDLLADRCRVPAARAPRRTSAAGGITPAALRRLVEAYTDVHLGFTAIHPYADGNGRMARLLANVPTLRAGQPPLLILLSRRRTYLSLMGDYSLRRGRPRPGQPLIRAGRERSALIDFFSDQWRGSLKIVADYKKRQKARQMELESPTQLPSSGSRFRGVRTERSSGAASRQVARWSRRRSDPSG